MKSMLVLLEVVLEDPARERSTYIAPEDLRMLRVYSNTQIPHGRLRFSIPESDHRI